MPKSYKFTLNGKEYGSITELANELRVNRVSVYRLLELYDGDIKRVYDYYIRKKKENSQYVLNGIQYDTLSEICRVYDMCPTSVITMADRLNCSRIDAIKRLLLNRIHIVIKDSNGKRKCLKSMTAVAKHFGISKQAFHSYMKNHNYTVEEAFKKYSERQASRKQ